MIILEDCIEVKASPKQIFDWLSERLRDEKSYLAWHPEHVSLQWIRGEPLKEGSVMEIEEVLQGNLTKLAYRIIKIDRPRLIEFQSLFPLSIIAAPNRFLIESISEQISTFRATGKIRFPLWLFNKMHKAHPPKLAASKQHMREEGENLKAAVEQFDP